MAAIVFFSYSHKDEELRDQLEVHLSMLKRQNVIQTWHDRRIAVGNEFDGEIKQWMEDADVILFLVSPDFLASDYCYDIEVQRAMERHEAGQVRVIPVILRPCDWHGVPFGKLLATPTDGKPVTMFPNVDEAFLDIVKAIRAAIGQSASRPPEPVPPAAIPTGAERASEPRSSNLRVAKEFTERDVDQFKIDAFEYIARYFESSLKEVETRNSDIAATFRRIDANRFTAAGYRNGTKVAACTIFIGKDLLGGNGIAYLASDSGEGSSLNDSLGVFADEQALFLSPRWGSNQGSELTKLSMEGGAEHFWEIFMEPMQRAG